MRTGGVRAIDKTPKIRKVGEKRTQSERNASKLGTVDGLWLSKRIQSIQLLLVLRSRILPFDLERGSQGTVFHREQIVRDVDPPDVFVPLRPTLRTLLGQDIKNCLHDPLVSHGLIQRGGVRAIDLLSNDGRSKSREVHRVGDDDGDEVRLEGLTIDEDLGDDRRRR